jgi:hypothetical protein
MFRLKRRKIRKMNCIKTKKKRVKIKSLTMKDLKSTRTYNRIPAGHNKSTVGKSVLLSLIKRFKSK